MYSLLTTAGSSLVTQARAQGTPIRLTRFALAISNDVHRMHLHDSASLESIIEEIRSLDLSGRAQIKVVGTDIHRTVRRENELVLTCHLPASTPVEGLRWNALLLYGRIGTDPEQLVTFHWAGSDNPKFALSQDHGGLRYFFQLNLTVARLAETFDLDVLPVMVPSFVQITDFDNANSVVRQTHDHYIIGKHPNEPRAGAPHFAFASETQYFGMRMVDPESPTLFEQCEGLFENNPLWTAEQRAGLTLAFDAEHKPILSRKGEQLYRRLST